MARLYGKDYTRSGLRERVGDLSAICGTRRYTFAEGAAQGVDAIDVWTGGGFRFTCLPGRCLDVSFAEWRGTPLNYRSPSGEAHASFFEPGGFGWMRGWYGGLFVTCGLSQVGNPNTDEGEALGLHGRASYLPATDVSHGGHWEGDEYLITLSGRMRETVGQEAGFGPVLELHRTITTGLGQSGFSLHDEVENLAFSSSPLMMLYHFNGGWPIIDEDSHLIAPTRSVEYWDTEVGEGPAPHWKIAPRMDDYPIQVYFHETQAAADGTVAAALVNDSHESDGLGFAVRWRQEQLPRLNVWKHQGKGVNVVGLEPSNCTIEGRTHDRKQGILRFLEPGEVATFDLDCWVLAGREAITGFEAEGGRRLGQ